MLKESEYYAYDCNEGAVRQSTKIGKWKKAGHLQSEESLSNKYSKDRPEENRE